MKTADQPRDVESRPAVAEVPWNPWLGLVFAVAVFFAAQLLSGLLVSIYPALRHWSPTRGSHWLDKSVNAQFAFVLLAETGLVAAIYGFLRLYRRRLSVIGLKLPAWRDLAYGLVAVPVYYLIFVGATMAISYFVPSLNINQHQDIGFTNVRGAWQLSLTFVSLVVLPPLAEEILFRGFLYGSLKKAGPAWLAVILTSGVFAAAHLPEGGAGGPLYIAALDTFVLSLVLIYLRERTGSLWASITLHAFKNGLAFVSLFALHLK